jgi:hypothetical protein
MTGERMPPRRFGRMAKGNETGKLYQGFNFQYTTVHNDETGEEDDETA